MFGVIDYFKKIISWKDTSEPPNPSRPDPSGRSWLTEIPLDIRLNIFQFLQPQAICRSAQTCSTLNQTMHTPSIRDFLVCAQKQLAVAKIKSKLSQAKQEALAMDSPTMLLNTLFNIEAQELEHGLFAEAIETAKEITKWNYDHGVDAFVKIVKVEAEQGLYKQAKMTVDQFNTRHAMDEGYRHLMYREIIQIEIKNGLLDQAKATTQLISSAFGSRDQALGIIAIAEAELGLYEQSKKTVALFVSHRPEFKDATYKEIAAIEMRNGLFDQAKATARQITDLEMRNSLLESITQAENSWLF